MGRKERRGGVDKTGGGKRRDEKRCGEGEREGERKGDREINGVKEERREKRWDEVRRHRDR